MFAVGLEFENNFSLAMNVKICDFSYAGNTYSEVRVLSPDSVVSVVGVVGVSVHGGLLQRVSVIAVGGVRGGCRMRVIRSRICQ